MKIYGRKIIDRETPIDLDGLCEVVFDYGKGRRLAVSLYRARENGIVEIYAEGGDSIAVTPHAHAANVIRVKPQRF